MKQIHYIILSILAACALPAMADSMFMQDHFSVYSLGNIGTPDGFFQATGFYGVAGAAGSVHLTSATLGPQDDYALHVGGDLSTQYTNQFIGSLAVTGNVNFISASIYGDVYAGGNVSKSGWSALSIDGSVYAAGTVDLPESVNVDSVHSGQPFAPVVDFQAVSSHYLGMSTMIGGMSSTGAVTEQWGELVFTGQSGTNVIEMDQQTLRNAWGFTITAPSDALVYINVPDASVVLDDTTWILEGGITKDAVLLNLANATEFSLSGTNAVNILAPLATTQFGQGTLDGALVAGNLYGGGTVNGGIMIPEPTLLSLLVMGGLMLLGRRRQA